MGTTKQYHAQTGFTLVELMIAVVIGLFLLGGLSIVVQDNKRAFASQSALSQLQDSERLAMTMIADTIQVSGYYPQPTVNTAAALLPAAGPMVAGQAVYGISGVGAPGDSITVRYATASGDTIPNCSGLSNTSGAVTAYSNTYQVVAATQQLTCTMNGTTYTLIGGVNNLTILYGVKTNFAVNDNTPDTYMTAAQVTAAGGWANVESVMVTLSFNNPSYVAGTAQPLILNFTRVVELMNRAGVSVN